MPKLRIICSAKLWQCIGMGWKALAVGCIVEVLTATAVWSRLVVCRCSAFRAVRWSAVASVRRAIGAPPLLRLVQIGLRGVLSSSAFGGSRLGTPQRRRVLEWDVLVGHATATGEAVVGTATAGFPSSLHALLRADRCSSVVRRRVGRSGMPSRCSSSLA